MTKGSVTNAFASLDDYEIGLVLTVFLACKPAVNSCKFEEILQDCLIVDYLLRRTDFTGSLPSTSS